MIHYDALTALRENDAEWTAGQKGLAAMLNLWRARPEVAPVLAALERFGEGEPMEASAELAVLFDGAKSTARDFVSGFVETGLAGLGAHPLGQLPLRHGTTRAAHTLLLAHSGSASLALVVSDGEAVAALPPAASAEFAPLETWSHVLVGSGVADRVICSTADDAGADLRTETVPMQPGTAHYCNGRYEALQMRSIRGSLLELRLQRFLGGHEPVREYALADGTLVHRAAARPEDSRRELAVAVLARMDRRDAVPAMSRIATGAGPEGLRWQALRELLTLDTRAGMVLLAQVAASEDDPLGAPAQELHASLLAAWPELERVAQWQA